MNEYEKILAEIKELTEKIHPPAAQVTEIDHLKAKLRFFFDNVLFEKIYDMNQFMNYHLEPVEKQTKTPDEYEKLKERAIKSRDSLYDLDEMADNEERDIWDCHEHTNKVAVHLASSLSTSHAGDCTAFPFTCERCMAETTYKIPYTANWGKADGHRIYYRLQKLEEQKNSVEFASELENKLGAGKDSTGQFKLKI